MLRAFRWLAFLCAAWVCLALPAQAIEPDKYLPNDTDAVVSINLQQIFNSPLVKLHYKDSLPEAFKFSPELDKLLTGGGIDPVKDLDQIIFANGEGLYRLTKGVENGKTVYGSTGGYYALLKGRFNVAKVRGYADQLVKDKDPLVSKTHKAGAATIYELDLGKPLYVAVLDGTTIVLSSRLDPVTEALEKATGKRKTAFKYKELAPALAKIDGKKAGGVAVLGTAAFGLDAGVKKVGNNVIETPIKQMLNEEGIDGISASLQVTDGIALDAVVAVRGSAAAKDVAKSLGMDVTDLIDIAIRGLFKYPKLGPVAEFVKAIKVEVKDAKTVTIKSAVDAKQVADSLK